MAQRKLRMAKIEPLKPKAQPAATQVATTPGKVPGFKAAPGRPESNIGRYLIKPTDKAKTGYEMLNTESEFLERTKEYLKKYELPPALQPKYLRKPEVMENQRRREISKGWVKPRNQVL
jgi:hypothetical protein